MKKIIITLMAFLAYTSLHAEETTLKMPVIMQSPNGGNLIYAAEYRFAYEQKGIKPVPSYFVATSDISATLNAASKLQAEIIQKNSTHMWNGQLQRPPYPTAFDKGDLKTCFTGDPAILVDKILRNSGYAYTFFFVDLQAYVHDSKATIVGYDEQRVNAALRAVSRSRGATKESVVLAFLIDFEPLAVEIARCK